MVVVAFKLDLIGIRVGMKIIKFKRAYVAQRGNKMRF